MPPIKLAIVGAGPISDGGTRLWICGQEQSVEAYSECRYFYRRFSGLIRRGESDVDVSPLRHLADAFNLGKAVCVTAHPSHGEVNSGK